MTADLAAMTPRERESFEERAAIIEEGCKVPRAEAEARALDLWRKAKAKRLVRRSAVED